MRRAKAGQLQLKTCVVVRMSVQNEETTNSVIIYQISLIYKVEPRNLLQFNLLHVISI